MKFAVTFLLTLLVTADLVAGPGSPSTFLPSITRQDFTGHGTYHRQGLLREQERAVSAQERSDSQTTQSKSGEACGLEKLWKTLCGKPQKSNKP